MALDPRIILGLRPLASPAELQDDRDRREINRQEVELRRQDIDLRRQALAQRGLPGQPKPFDPVAEGHAMDYRIKQASAVANLLKRAKADPSSYPQVRSTIGQLVPEAASHLPEQYDDAMVTGMIADGDALIAKAATAAGKTREIRVPQADGSERIMIVSDEPGQEWTAAPKPITASSSPNPTEASLAVAAAKGDKDAAAALRIIRGQRVGAGGSGGATSASGLVDAVMANPAVFNTLTPTSRTAITPELAKRGFDFEGHAKSAAPTGAQNKTLTFFNRAKQASEDLEGVEDKISAMGTAKQAWNASVPAALQSQDAQLYTQAQRLFTEARLRKESGAAIPENEFANDRRMYFVQPGDTAATVEQKRRSRANLLASMANESGPALGQFYGDDEGKAMIVGYREASKPKGPQQRAAASPKTAPTGVEQWERGTDGKLHKVTR